MNLLTQEEVETLRQECVSPLQQRLLDLYGIFAESPYVDSYLTMFGQIDDLNEQLQIDGTTFIGEGGIQVSKGKIQITDSQERGFDRMLRYFEKITLIHANLDDLRSKMLPQQQIDVDYQRKIRLISRKKTGKQNGPG